MPRRINTTGAFPHISQKNIYFANNLCYNKHVYVDLGFTPIFLMCLLKRCDARH